MIYGEQCCWITEPRPASNPLDTNNYFFGILKPESCATYLKVRVSLIVTVQCKLLTGQRSNIFFFLDKHIQMNCGDNMNPPPIVPNCFS